MTTPKTRLAELRKRAKPDQAGRYRIRVGMATCGLSAGADKVYEAFGDALKEAGALNVDVISTGCVGRCDLEPMAEVTRGDEPPVLYIRLDAEKARRIVLEHIVGSRIVDEYVGQR